jgi:hypothetical protein
VQAASRAVTTTTPANALTRPVSGPRASGVSPRARPAAERRGILLG